MECLHDACKKEMQQEGNVAVVIGCTGLVGKNLVDLLIPHKQKVIIISRRREHPWMHVQKVHHIYLENFDDMNSKEDQLDGVTEAYCAIGSSLEKKGIDEERFIHVELDYPIM